MAVNIFKNDTNSKFLPIVSALIVFLASISLAIVFLSSRALNSWKYTIESSLSIQVMPEYDAKNPESEKVARAQKLKEFLEKDVMVKSVKIISKNTMNELMKPWLHKDFKTKYAIFPEVLEVKTFKNLPKEDFETLENAISKQDKNTKVYRHEDWVKKAGLITRIFNNLAYIILGISLVAMFGVISYSTKTSMLIQIRIVRLLNIMGAKDNFIAKIFAMSTAKLCLIGGIFGTLIAFPVLFFIIYVAQNSNSSLFALLDLAPANWVVVGCLPFACFLIAAISSYRTVMKTLRKGPKI